MVRMGAAMRKRDLWLIVYLIGLTLASMIDSFCIRKRIGRLSYAGGWETSIPQALNYTLDIWLLNLAPAAIAAAVVMYVHLRERNQ